MTLRELAEKAARETFIRVCEELNDSSEPISPREQRYINAYADAIERVARAFALRAVIRALEERDLEEFGQIMGDIMADSKKAYANKIIAAAEAAE